MILGAQLAQRLLDEAEDPKSVLRALPHPKRWDYRLVPSSDGSYHAEILFNGTLVYVDGPNSDKATAAKEGRFWVGKYRHLENWAEKHQLPVFKLSPSDLDPEHAFQTWFEDTSDEWVMMNESEDPKQFLKRHSAKKQAQSHQLSVGEEVISGTGDTRDIMEACFDTLKRLDKARFAAELSDHDVYQYTTLGEVHNDFDPEYYLYERLFSILQKYCPPFTYFGSYEADGSIGCWPLDNMTLEDMEEGKVTLVDEHDNPEQANAIRRGDFGGIPSPYVVIDKQGGGKELWNTQTFEKVWDW